MWWLKSSVLGGVVVTVTSMGPMVRWKASLCLAHKGNWKVARVTRSFIRFVGSVSPITKGGHDLSLISLPAVAYCMPVANYSCHFVPHRV